MQMLSSCRRRAISPLSTHHSCHRPGRRPIALGSVTTAPDDCHLPFLRLLPDPVDAPLLGALLDAFSGEVRWVALSFCTPPEVARMWPRGRAPPLNSNCFRTDLSPLPGRCGAPQRIYTVPNRGISARSHFHASHDRRLLSFTLFSSALVTCHLLPFRRLFPPPILFLRARWTGISAPSGFIFLPHRHARFRR